MDCSPPGPSVHGISQARILEWVAISFSKGSSQPRDQTCLLPHCSRILYHWTTKEDALCCLLNRCPGAGKGAEWKGSKEKQYLLVHPNPLSLATLFNNNFPLIQWSPAYSFSYSLMTSFLTILLIYLAVSGLICGLKNLGCVRGNLSWQCTDFLVAIQELQSERASVVTGHGQWPPGMYCTMNSFFKISWILITLQYYSGFCHTLTWISRGVTCIPHPDPPSHLLTY